MPTPEIELEFTRIWKGIRKKIDMSKVMRYRKKDKREAAFKKELSELPVPSKNLKNMKQKNISKLLSIAILDRERYLKKKEKSIKKKKLLSPADQKNLSELQNLRRIKKGLSKSKLKQGQKIQRRIKREELITQDFKKRGIKIKTSINARKGKRGRKPYAKKKQINLFGRKKIVRGKTKKFKVFGSVKTKTKELWVIEANIKTGKIILRDKKTGRFSFSKSIITLI